MSLKVAANEHGMVRVFTLGFPVSKTAPDHEAITRLAQILDVAQINAADVQIVDLGVIREMGLPTFLAEGYGLDESDVAQFSDVLGGLTGHIAILRSGAFGGAALTLRASEDAPLIATFNEPRMSAPAPMPSYDSASGSSGGKTRKPVSDKAMSGRIAMYALLAVFAFTIMFVWIAS